MMQPRVVLVVDGSPFRAEANPALQRAYQKSVADATRIAAYRTGADERKTAAQAKRDRKAHKRKMDNMTAIAGQIVAGRKLNGEPEL